MIGARGRRLAALLALGVAACTAAAPVPATPGSEHGSVPPSAGPVSAAPSAAAEASTPEPSARTGRYHLDLEVGRLDPAWTVPLQQFASDGEAVIFSSGVADGPTAAGTPDLWRFVPGSSAPELLWSNPQRDRQLIRIAGDRGTWAFVDISINAEHGWDLWLLPSAGSEAVLLDRHPGDEDVSGLVPSLVVHEQQVAWTAFDRGPNGPVSQLWLATAPEWRPRLLAERLAAEAELWLPSMLSGDLVYTEVRYSADRSSDERHVYLINTRDMSVEPRRLDSSGRATMPIFVDDGVVWKEADPGFNMFNWGRLFEYRLDTGEVTPLSMQPQEYVNYPSAGLRFVAAWGADAFKFAVHDLDLHISRRIATYEPETGGSVLRPHVSGDLLVWLYSETDDMGRGPPGEIRYAFLPGAGTDRNRDWDN